jgi:hypothetical protein
LERVTETSSSTNILREVDKKFETLNKSLDEKFDSFFLQMQDDATAEERLTYVILFCIFFVMFKVNNSHYIKNILNFLPH